LNGTSHKVGKDSTSTNHGWDSFGDNWWTIMHCATNGPIASMLKDQVESSVGS
jgi:hypothetical protein